MDKLFHPGLGYATIPFHVLHGNARYIMMLVTSGSYSKYSTEYLPSYLGVLGNLGPHLALSILYSRVYG